MTNLSPDRGCRSQRDVSDRLGYSAAQQHRLSSSSKLRAKIDTIRDDRKNIERTLEQAENQLDNGIQFLTLALDLMTDPNPQPRHKTTLHPPHGHTHPTQQRRTRNRIRRYRTPHGPTSPNPCGSGF
jgi:hypothetical protein